MACGDKYMKNEKQCRCWEQMEVNGVLFKIRVEQDGNCANVFATPCTLPSAVYQIARVCELVNNCTQFEYYEAQIYSDPVETIIDCDFCQIIRRALEYYLENANFDGCCRRNNSFLGLF